MQQLSVHSDSDSADYGAESGSDLNDGEQRDFDLAGLLASEQAQLPQHVTQICMTPEQLGLKSKSWRTANRKRYSDRKKIGYVDAQKELLPPEVLR